MSSLRVAWATLKRELFGYFVSPVSYLVLALFVLVQGYGFFLLCQTLAKNQAATSAVLTRTARFIRAWILEVRRRWTAAVDDRCRMMPQDASRAPVFHPRAPSTTREIARVAGVAGVAPARRREPQSTTTGRRASARRSTSSQVAIASR